MRRITYAILALSFVGCASAARIERSADRHQAKAEELAASGDLVGARKEQAAADKQRSKANTRRAYEAGLPIAFH